MRNIEIIEEIKLFQETKVCSNFKSAKNVIHQNYTECLKKGVLICSKDPWEFIGAFLASVVSGIPVFLGNHNWRETEWNQVSALISPALVFGNAPTFPSKSNSPLKDLKPFSNHIMIPTGGSGGKVQFAMHTFESLHNSAISTATFLKKNNLNSLCLLPLYHISGLIQVIRAAVTNGELLFNPLESFEKNRDFKGFSLSLVPTQLERLMQNADNINLLKTFDVIFLGGAPAANELLQKARIAKIRLSPTYGMTETGSMITALHPDDFLMGIKGVGTSLCHAKIFITEENLINIYSNSLFSGYFPETPTKKVSWQSNDEGNIDEKGYLTIIGRADRIIITGGEKVDPREIETAILATGLASSVLVASIEDEEWGRRIIAIYVALIKGENLSSQIKERLKANLVNYKIPRDWILVDELPYDEKGKLTETSINHCIKSFRLLLEETQK
jgi:O-succinylbenzoic acid--CoA ligase